MRRGVSVAAGCVVTMAVAGCGLSPVAGRPTTGAATSSATATAAHTPGATSSPQISGPVASGPAGPTRVPVGPSGSPRAKIPKPAKVDGHNAAAVAHAYTVTAWSWDTRLDESPNDAARRATRWMSKDLAAAFATPLPGDGGAAWRHLAAVKGYTSVHAVQVADAGSHSGYRAVVPERVTLTRHRRGGKRLGTPDTFLVLVTLVRETKRQPWRVSTTKVSG